MQVQTGLSGNVISRNSAYWGECSEEENVALSEALGPVLLNLVLLREVRWQPNSLS